MARPSQKDVVAALLARHGTTYAREAGNALDGAGPAALWRLLCLSLLLSARISAALAVAAARALANEGWTTPRKLADSTWERRAKVLNEAGYARIRAVVSGPPAVECVLGTQRGHVDRATFYPLTARKCRVCSDGAA